jgi:drug/metabolite transporter (DMT)-like permease
MYVVSDVVLEIIPPFTLLTIRLFLALIVLTALLRGHNPAAGLARRQVLALVGVGMLGFGISVGAQFVGTDKSTAINGTLITSASPAFILVFAALLLHERLSPIQVAAVALATLGVIVIIDPASASFGSQTFLGDLALLVAAVTWGLYSVLVRRVSRDTDTLRLTWLAFVGGLLITIPAAALELGTRAVGPITVPVLLGILYLGVISTAGAMWWWNRAFALVPASTASLFFFAQPLVGAVLSVALLGQPMTANLWMGSGCIVVAVLLALRTGRAAA